MTRFHPLAWLMLAVWASWFSALQALCVSRTFLGSWTPDLGLLLLVACAGRLHARDVPLATLVLALARLAYTVEPPAAVLAAFLATSVLCQVLRRIAELGNPAMRVGLSGLGALGLTLWFAFVHAARTGADPAGALSSALLPGLATATTSAVLGLLFLGSLVHLPGLTPLRERRW